MKQFTVRLTAFLLAAVILTTLILTATAAPMATHIGIVKARGGLRLRSDATTASKILDTAHYGDSVVILEKKGSWYKVNYNLQIGYMSGDYLTLKERENVDLGRGSIDGSVVNMRSAPNTGSKIVTQLKRNNTVEIFGFNCGWYKVRTAADQIGYIRSDLLKLLDKPAENFGVASNGNSSAPSLTAGEKLAAYAKTFVGYPYVYGGSSPDGFDCSGFTQYCARQMGYTIQRTATAQLSNGTKVSRENLKPGDLVFFGYGSTASHVGIYIGDGKFVHASSPEVGVIVSKMNSAYYTTGFVGGRRIV